MRNLVWSILFLNLVVGVSQTPTITSADSLYALGDYTKAINIYAKIGGEVARLQIARSYSTIGNFEKAIVEYESLCSSNPNNQLAQFELGKLLLKVKLFSKAIPVFTHLVSLNSKNPEYYYYLGEAKREEADVDASLKNYKKAISLDTTHLRSLFQLAKYYTIKRERDRALDYIGKGLDFYENDVALVNLKALVLYNDYQYENAIPWFEKVLELGETKNYVYEKLADCYYHNWEFKKAKQAYQLLLARDDANSETYFSLAGVYQKEKKLDSAKFFIKKAMDVQKPIFAQGYGSLANIARQEGDLPTALKFYKRAHDEDKTEARIYYQICTLYDQIGTDREKKLVYYQEFLKQYPNEHPYFYESVRKRISELKEQIHFSKD